MQEKIPKILFQVKETKIKNTILLFFNNIKEHIHNNQFMVLLSQQYYQKGEYTKAKMLSKNVLNNQASN